MSANILNNKENLSLYNDPSAARDFRRPTDILANINSRYYNPDVHQRFISNIMNPDNSEKSLHLYHSTGSGKTLGSLGIAHEFTKAFRRIYEQNRAIKKQGWRSEIYLSPTVFILGFTSTQKVFKKEIMRFSEFGIVSQVELLELDILDGLAKSGISADIIRYKEFKDRIKRRITDKNKGGFYQFIGYEELINRLFFSETHDIQDLEIQADKEGVEFSVIIERYIADESVQINRDFIDLFENSLVICDEIHVTYNNARKNGRGVALQYIINIVKNMRLVTLSATPFKSLPRECVSWVNYHLSIRNLPSIVETEFFSDDRTMRPGKLEEFGKLTQGFVSFFQNIDSREYPERIFVGTAMVLPGEAGDFAKGAELPYLKFIECPMSELHQATYDHYMRENNTDKLASGSRALLDVVFPNPESEYGAFKSREIVSNVLSAKSNWRITNGVEVRKHTFGTSVLTGPWLHNIGKWSVKYGEMIRIVLDIIANNGELARSAKIMLYHNKVRNSGVLFIQEILLQNGFVDELSNPTDHTRCWICSRYLVDHDIAIDNHAFIPARFVIAHSNVDKKALETSIDKFNSSSNKNGEQYGIMLGSKIISESIDFKDIQHMIILSAPVNISSLIQIFGRAIRKNANISLPPNQRKTRIRILVSTCRDGSDAPVSSEVNTYAVKLSDYLSIQLIEREVIKNALDVELHWPTIMMGVSREVNNLGALWVDQPTTTIKMTEIKLANFNNRGYADREVINIMYIIKRLFLHQAAWTYDNLINAVHAPPLQLTINPALFSEGNIVIALSFLLKQIATHEIHARLNNLVESLYNPASRVIYKNNVPHRISKVGNYYILFPVNVVVVDPKKVKDNIKMLGYAHNILDDVETYMSHMTYRKSTNVDIAEFISSSTQNEEFTNIAKNLNKRTSEMQGDDLPLFFLYDYSEEFQRWFLAKSIESIHNNSGEVNGAVIKLCAALDLIISTDEIIKYSAIHDRFSAGTQSYKLVAGNPIGYCLQHTARLFNPLTNAWFEIDKIDINRSGKFKENDIITFLQDERGTIKFKVSEVISSKKGDKRRDKRGMVCEYRDKDNILEMAADLGISLKKYDKGKMNVKQICAIIRDFIINKEIRERQRQSQYTWLYGWWSTPHK